MKLQGFKRINQEDYPAEIRESIEKVGYCINIFATEVVSAFNDKRISIENLNLGIINVEVNVKNVDGDVNGDIQIKSPLNTQAAGLQCIQAVNLTNSNIYPTSTPWISFTEKEKIITIKNVKGLQVDNRYKLTVFIIGN